jgi:hypothetical protein
MTIKQVALVILISGLLILSNVSFAAPSVWAEQAVLWLKVSEVIPTGLFPVGSEQKAITREQFSELAVHLYAKAKGVSVDLIGYSLPFKDTQNLMVGRAYHLGIVKGLTADTFGPSEKITREQLATMLYRELKLLDIPGSYTQGVAFADGGSFSSYAVDAIYFCKANGLVNGVGQNKFAPKSNTTIEQAQLIVFNILKAYKWSVPVHYQVDKSYNGFKVPSQTEISISSDSDSKLALRLVLPVSSQVQGWSAEKNQWEVYGILRSHPKVTYAMAEKTLLEANRLWDGTRRQYSETTMSYIDIFGISYSIKPLKGPYVRIDSRGTLTIEIQFE